MGGPSVGRGGSGPQRRHRRGGSHSFGVFGDPDPIKLCWGESKDRRRMPRRWLLGHDDLEDDSGGGPGVWVRRLLVRSETDVEVGRHKTWKLAAACVPWKLSGSVQNLCSLCKPPFDIGAFLKLKIRCQSACQPARTDGCQGLASF